MPTNIFERRSGTKAKWTDGKRIVTGEWEYRRSCDNFAIRLDSKDPITGRQRMFIVYDDVPEWGKFKLIQEKT